VFLIIYKKNAMKQRKQSEVHFLIAPLCFFLFTIAKHIDYVNVISLRLLTFAYSYPVINWSVISVLNGKRSVSNR